MGLLLKKFLRHKEIYPKRSKRRSPTGAPERSLDEFPDWIVLDGLLFSIARLRFTSRSRSCFSLGPSQGELRETKTGNAY